MEDIGLAHGLVRFLHILLFVYWLGGDAGVFYSSRFVVNPGLTREARLAAAKIFLDLDMIPRYCMALMLTVGGILEESWFRVQLEQEAEPERPYLFLTSHRYMLMGKLVFTFALTSTFFKVLLAFPEVEATTS